MASTISPDILSQISSSASSHFEEIKKLNYEV